MLYIPYATELPGHNEGKYRAMNAQSRFAHMVYWQIIEPSIQAMEQHERMLAILGMRWEHDTPEIRQIWYSWKKEGELTSDTILKHLLRDGRVTREMGGYSGCYASWYYRPSR
jgi:hypothetical protein